MGFQGTKPDIHMTSLIFVVIDVPSTWNGTFQKDFHSVFSVVVAHPPGKWKAQVQFLVVDQQFSYDWALCFLALLMRPDRSKWACIYTILPVAGWVLCMCIKPIIPHTRMIASYIYALYVNCPRGVVVAHPPGKWKAQVRFLAVEQQFSYDWALCFLALLMRPDRLKWACIYIYKWH